MKEEKDINRLFRESMEQAPKGLSNSIMDKIAAEEKADWTVMQMAGLDSPSENFASNVMREVTKNRYATQKPKLAWVKWASAAAACFFIVAIIGLGGIDTSTHGSSYIELTPLLVKHQTTFISALAILLVLLADQLYRRAKLNDHLG